MRITCPHCGPRGIAEFTCFGNAPGRRPADDAPVAEWVDWVYFPPNPRGPVTELWQHVMGCRAWLRVTRDTATHAITEVAPAAAALR